MKPVRIVTITLFVSWAVFLLGDYIDESLSYNTDFAFLAAIFLPFIVTLLYLVFQKRVHDKTVDRWENIVIVLGIWILENIFLVHIIRFLMKKDIWFIQQNTDGWENLLNGLEYYVIYVFNIFVPLIIVTMWNIIVWLYKKWHRSNLNYEEQIENWQEDNVDKKSQLTTLCYIEKDNQYLMLHRVKKDRDVNKDKWIGVGGHFEEGESPEECLLREVKEETGLTLTSYRFRGIVTFIADGWQTEYMCLYTADGFTGELTACNEGALEWVDKKAIFDLNLWEGDKVFFRLLEEQDSFFSLKLEYRNGTLRQCCLDGKSLELIDIRRPDGSLTGQVRERTMVHRDGDLHGTSHIWLIRRIEKWEGDSLGFDIMLQKRSGIKDSYPGCLDISSAGHLASGDDYLESSVRELKEELGIVAQPEELHYIFTHIGYTEDVFYGHTFKNYEVSKVFLYDDTLKQNQMKLQKEEVESVMWMDYDTCLLMMREEKLNHCIYMDEFEEIGPYARKLLAGLEL